ncbi:hypothetical protein [Saccharibacter floricola]|uniref:Uncharacterized protein n=1 Tax=Saccharibacter floricola DSM 15669 TaxID=1123227 RepID=A0ABQ0P254_9PROT|nr:hypothetical protein [Saccharibacter floricola]GBQ08931.1 hypothetical protein AA15669_1969 [Saccharibacter floricola DSM 15669]
MDMNIGSIKALTPAKAGQKAAMAWLHNVVSGKVTFDKEAVVDQSDDWSRYQSRMAFHRKEGSIV